ncbi:MAG: DNA polymerase Y family protein [Alphaproteobacteria bacterium]|nr:DNA polymerase Y family protein [Alphaproteobacteria bacterium]
MFRYLVVHLPCFRLERCGWSAQDAVALLAEEKSALRVQSMTPVASRAGVRRGMTAAEARAILPALQVEPLDPDAETLDLADVTAQLLRISPQVAPLPPDSLVAEISRTVGSSVAGQAARAGAERALLERVRHRMAALGHVVRAAIADDPGTALACAAWGRKSRIVPPGGGADALAGLPLEALGLPDREQDLLLGLGLDTVGAFAALPPASVVGRLGPVACAAHALARGGGPRPTLQTWQEDGPLVLSQDLMHLVCEQEALVFVLNALLRDAALRLAGAGRAAQRLVLRLTLDAQEDGLDDEERGHAVIVAPGGVQELSLRLGAPTRDPAHMLALLRARLDGLKLAGPVCRVSIELPEPVPFDGRQRDLLERQRAAEALDQVVARIQDELGADAVFVPSLAPVHRPEQAWLPVSVGQSRRDALQAAPRGGTHADLLGQQRPDGSDPVREWEGFATPPPALRPALLQHPPQAIEVRAVPDLGGRVAADLGDVPRAVHSDGRWVPCVGLAGPEQLAGEWWKAAMDRRYWAATLADGRRAWLYQEDGHWILHGWFD